MPKLLNMFRLKLLVILLLITQFCNSQTFPFDPGFDNLSGGGGNNQWQFVNPTVNFIKNGNFNQSYVPSCDTGLGCTNQILSGSNWWWNCDTSPGNAAIMTDLWQDSIDWPYRLDWICDIDQMAGTINNYNSYYLGFMEVNFIQPLSNGNFAYNYILFQFTNSLPVGTHFRFEMDVSGAPQSNGGVYTDQIGAAIVHDLPALVPNDYLGDQITPAVVSPTGIPIEIATYHMTYDFEGNGENFLIIGIFQNPGNLNTTGSIDMNPAKYWLDNVKLYRPECTNPHLNFNQDDVKQCVGSEHSFYASTGIAPYEWYLDGELQAETSNTYNFVFDSLDHIITVACDTGVCRTTASADILTSHLTFDLPEDTTMLCGAPVFIDTEFSIENLPYTSNWNYRIEDSEGTIIQESYSQYLSVLTTDFTALTGSEYFVNLELPEQNCFFRDSITVVDPGPLLLDSDGQSIIQLDIHDEQCVNASDGYIHILPGDYPLPLEYMWNDETSFNFDNTLDTLSFGNYSVWIRDSLWRCESHEFELFQLFDGCGIISGNVFADLDTNCTLDSADIRYSMIKIIAEPLGNFAFTDSLGHYELLVPTGEYSVHRVDTFTTLAPYCGYVEELVIIPTPGTILDSYHFVDTLVMDSVDLVLSSLTYSSLPILDNPFNVIAEWQNMSAYYVDASLIYYPLAEELTYFFDSIPFPLEIIGDTLIVYFEDIEPMEIVELTIPSHVIQYTSNIGIPLYSNAELNLISDNETDSTNNVQSFETSIRAAYDPNIKTSIPEGFRDQRYTDVDIEQLEYYIQFQNTGNYFATNVSIIDTLDVSLLPESIEIMGASHYMEVIYYNGVVRFVFPNIMLPDSTSNESESHGHVHFKISPRENVPHLTEITNTAYIYFDSNEAIVTNTTLNTLYDCDVFTPDFVAIMEGDCPEYHVDADFTSDYIDSNEWWINGTLWSTELALEANLSNESTTILHIISNELCGVKQHIENLEPLESYSLDLSSSNGLITATTDLNAVQYTWYLNDQIFAITTSNSLETNISGGYSVVAIDEFGCTASENHFEYLYINVVDAISSQNKLYPNPADEFVIIDLKSLSGSSIIELVDMSGQVVQTVAPILQTTRIDCENVASGCYLLKVRNQGEFLTFPLIIAHKP